MTSTLVSTVRTCPACKGHLVPVGEGHTAGLRCGRCRERFSTAFHPLIVNGQSVEMPVDTTAYRTTVGGYRGTGARDLPSVLHVDCECGQHFRITLIHRSAGGGQAEIEIARQEVA